MKKNIQIVSLYLLVIIVSVVYVWLSVSLGINLGFIPRGVDYESVVEKVNYDNFRSTFDSFEECIGQADSAVMTKSIEEWGKSYSLKCTEGNNSYYSWTDGSKGLSNKNLPSGVFQTNTK